MVALMVGLLLLLLLNDEASSDENHHLSNDFIPGTCQMLSDLTIITTPWKRLLNLSVEEEAQRG